MTSPASKDTRTRYDTCRKGHTMVRADPADAYVTRALIASRAKGKLGS